MTQTWPLEHSKWDAECVSLMTDDSSKLPQVNLSDLLRNTREFPIEFPEVTMLCENLIYTVAEEILERNICSAYPIIHEHSLHLCAKFLLFKRNHGTEIEKKLYQNVSLKGLIQRLLFKRAVSFFGKSDSYFLIDKTQGTGNWHTIGTEEEMVPLILENCLSYDEIKLSALLSVSSYSYFINDGNRVNAGYVEENRSNIEEEGIIIGLVGTRFEQLERMEYQEIIISHFQNTEEKGYGCSSLPTLPRIFAEFYEEEPFLYNNMQDNRDTRFVELEAYIDYDAYFDNTVYSKRLALSFDTLLIEANHRAKLRNKFAYIHVIGIGLGLWRISSHQIKIFLNTFVNRLGFLGDNLKNVSDVHFSHICGESNFERWKSGDILHIDSHPNQGVKLLISDREPFTKLLDKSIQNPVVNKTRNIRLRVVADKLLVASYSWDGNALPGNEFWLGQLTFTSDSSAASSSQIIELHNPHINPLVCANNLHVAMLDGTVKPVDEVFALLRKNVIRE